MNNTKFYGCSSEDCKLNDFNLSFVKRIKSHCLDCVPEQSVYGVKACNGKILNPVPHICPLHEFRLGKNPKRVESGIRKQKNMAISGTWKPNFELKPKRHGIGHVP